MSHPSSCLFVLTTMLAASVALPAYADNAFNRIATFPVAQNLPADTDAKTPTSSEIIKVSEDGNTLVYSDSPLGAVGFVDISDAKAPKAGGIVKIDGEPTSVMVIGNRVLAGVNTSESKKNPSGNLTIIDLASKQVVASCDLGGQPDSVAVSADGKFAAVAIENERDEDLDEGELPQLPAGDLKIFSLTDATPDCATMKTILMIPTRSLLIFRTRPFSRTVTMVCRCSSKRVARFFDCRGLPLGFPECPGLNWVSFGGRP